MVTWDATDICSVRNHHKIFTSCDDLRGIKRKRGRPRGKSRHSLRGQMSDVTKKKLADSSKKFSLCKLCSKQCRGFRGLVDHMHRDHEDYKPWRCHLCEESSAFVKTLFKHLKQEHGVTERPCETCGVTFSRAQSMLQHFNKVRSQEKLCMST